MKVISEMSLNQFEFWGGAKDRACDWSYDELEALTEVLDDMYPEGLEDVQINDMMWFDEDYLRELIGKPKEEEEGE